MAASLCRTAQKAFHFNGIIKSVFNIASGSSSVFSPSRQVSNIHATGKKLWPESSVFFPGFIQKRSITLLTTFKVIDNSALGQRVKKNRQPYLIGFYRKRKTADPGDVIRVAVAGKTNKAIVIGTRKTKHHTVPRYDNNCIVLVDENLAPLGTRIKGPVPTILRRRQDKYSKVLALASRFI
ncbi:unnamed protein product [Porites evermanni]|uniref:Large ribosomal subunit protein uL14m n=1 Tax=Porites evermanni TaxID=104178 RepID=A0ABN8SC60_9CNID|nr:unnamed protein product [Porites evermanni]